MVFNSAQFAIFFTILCLLFWLLRFSRAYQNSLLLSGSLFCYSFFHFSFPIYLLVLISIAYIFGIYIGKTEVEKKRKGLLYLSLFLLTIGLLYLKYSGLIIGGITGISQWQASALHLLVPVGISFFTFTSIGYILDVYRGQIEPEKNFITFAAYISFYPCLLIGPIPRADTVLPQFKKRPTLTIKGMDQSVGEILWGLFKKIVVADNLSLGVEYCFQRHNELNGSTVLIGSLLFLMQLYSDFSGYSDMARGLARLLGIEIIRNFNDPFSSKSISEFWKRWHISLSSWFYDYIFNPFVASFRHWRKWSIAAGFLITFLICGFWHGASWNYIFWGLLFGIALNYEVFTRSIRMKYFGLLPIWLNSCLSVFFTFSYVLLSGVFVRAGNIKEGFEIVGKIFSISTFSLPLTFIANYLKWLLPLFIIEFTQRKGQYTFDLEQWRFSDRLAKINSNKLFILTTNIFVKLVLYAILGFATFVFYKRVNMAEYLYFKY